MVGLTSHFGVLSLSLARSQHKQRGMTTYHTSRYGEDRPGESTLRSHHTCSDRGKDMRPAGCQTFGLRCQRQDRQDKTQDKTRQGTPKCQPILLAPRWAAKT
mmetsp:Transcript_59933/g.131390  ORF Transcript_59933/g.131390 Transcript_59933/m.131390 type:complete len:102 (-) Transcript_59933:83-388(-)